MTFFNAYRWCIVANCNNSTSKTPEKLFIKVPNDIAKRNVWLELSGRDPTTLSTKSVLHLCEDHFNLEQDMENFIQFKIMGSVKKIRMKPNTIPSKFSHKPIVSANKAQLLNKESSSTSVHSSSSTSYTSEDSPPPTVSNENVAEYESSESQTFVKNEDLAFGRMTQDESPASDLHVGYKCNMCESDIRGYVCVQCADWDMCGACEARGRHSLHYVLRVPAPRPQMQVKSLIEALQKQLEMFLDNLDPLKTVKDEPENDNEVTIKEEPADALQDLLIFPQTSPSGYTQPEGEIKQVNLKTDFSETMLLPLSSTYDVMKTEDPQITASSHTTYPSHRPDEDSNTEAANHTNLKRKPPPSSVLITKQKRKVLISK